MRVNMVIPDDLLEKIDAKAKSLYVSRTAFVITTLAQKLKEDSVLEKMPDMVDIMKRFSPDDMQEQNADCIERPQTRDNDSSS